MREAIGGGWLFQIVIFFVLLFSGYMALSINYSKAFKVKNELIDIIERNKGTVDPKNPNLVLEEIQTYLDNTGYKSTGYCQRKNNANDNTDWYGLNRFGQLEIAQSGSQYYLCIKKLTNQYSKTNPAEVPYAAYYRIMVFFNLDLPVLGDLFDLTVVGDSETIHYPTGL